MKLNKVRKYHKVTVEFFCDGEPAELKIKVNCLTPRKMKEFIGSMDDDSNFEEMVETNCKVICGWEDVTDEEGESVPFSKERLRDLQMDFYGLADAIYVSIIHKAKELRADSLKKLVDSTEPLPQNG